MTIIYIFFICTTISTLLLIINYYLSIYAYYTLKINLIKNVYECGFNPYIIDRSCFPRFYIVAILFLLFDLEVFFILLSIYLPLYIYISYFYIYIFIILTFILFIGMLFEWWYSIISNAGFLSYPIYLSKPIFKPWYHY